MTNRSPQVGNARTRVNLFLFGSVKRLSRSVGVFAVFRRPAPSEAVLGHAPARGHAGTRVTRRRTVPGEELERMAATGGIDRGSSPGVHARRTDAGTIPPQPPHRPGHASSVPLPDAQFDDSLTERFDALAVSLVVIRPAAGFEIIDSRRTGLERTFPVSDRAERIPQRAYVSCQRYRPPHPSTMSSPVSEASPP